MKVTITPENENEVNALSDRNNVLLRRVQMMFRSMFRKDLGMMLITPPVDIKEGEGTPVEPVLNLEGRSELKIEVKTVIE